MYDDISLTELRARLGHLAARVNHSGKRLLIHRNGRQIGALVPARDLHLLEEVELKSLTYKRYQVAEQLARWEAIKARIDAEEDGI